MKPIGKYIAIKDVAEEIVSQSGMVFSGEDAAKLRHKKGEVISQGTDVDKINSGDTIYYDKSNSFTMYIDGSPVIFIQERDVIVVL